MTIQIPKFGPNKQASKTKTELRKLRGETAATARIA
jgi:hypothetical protein